MRTGIVNVGSIRFQMAYSDMCGFIGMNHTCSKYLICVGGGAAIIDVSWINLISGNTVSFPEFLAHDHFESDHPGINFRSQLTLSKHLPLHVTSLVAISTDQLLICTDSGTTCTINWNGTILTSWSQANVHSVYRTSLPLTVTLSECKPSIRGDSTAPDSQGSKAALGTSNNTATNSDSNQGDVESEAGSEVWELDEDVTNVNTPQRSGSVAISLSWSKHTHLAAAVFEDGSLAFMHILVSPFSHRSLREGQNKGKGSSDPAFYADHLLDSNSSSMHPLTLMTNRLHPILPDDSGATAETMGATAPAKWAVDIVSRFMDVLMIDSSSSPANKLTGVEPRIARGEVYGDTGTLMVALVCTPSRRTYDDGSDDEQESVQGTGHEVGVSLSLVVFRVALTSVLSVVSGSMAGRRMAVECACSLSLGSATTTSGSCMQWTANPSGNTLFVLTGHTIRILALAPSGISCVLINCVHATGPTSSITGSPPSSGVVTPQPSREVANAHVFLATARTKLVVTVVLQASSLALTSSQVHVLPALLVAVTPTCPHSRGMLLEAGDDGEVSSLLICDTTMIRHTHNNIKEDARMQRDQIFDSTNSAHNQSGSPHHGGFIKTPLPARLRAALRSYRASCNTGGGNGQGSSGDTGLLIASSNISLVCVDYGRVPWAEPKAESGGTVPLLWVQDRRGLSKWRYLDFPDTTLALPPEYFWEDAGGEAGSIASNYTTVKKEASHSAAAAGTPVAAKVRAAGGWSVFGNCAVKSHETPLKDSVQPTVDGAQPAEILPDVQVACGPVRSVVALALFGQHSIVAVTVRPTRSNAGPEMTHLLEVVSRAPARTQVGPMMSTGSGGGRRHVVTLPALHVAYALSPYLIPRVLDLLPSMDHAFDMTSSNGGVAKEGSRRVARECSRGRMTSVGDEYLTGTDKFHKRNDPSIEMSEHSRTESETTIASASENSPVLSELSSDRMMSACTVLVGDGWHHVHCFVLQAALKSVTSSSSSQSHDVATTYSMHALWTLDLRAVLGPGPAIDFTYPIRETLLVPSDLKIDRGPNAMGTVPQQYAKVDVVLLDGLGNLIRLGVRPTTGSAERTEQSKVSRTVEVLVDSIGQGYIHMERVTAPPDFPVPLRYCLLLHPDGDTEAAAISDGKAVVCHLYYPLMPDLGLVAGPGPDHCDSSSSFSFGTSPCMVATTLRAHSIYLPVGGSVGSPMLGHASDDGGSLSLQHTSLTVYLVYGLLDSISGASADSLRTSELDSFYHRISTDTKSLLKDVLLCLRNHPHDMESLVRSLEDDWRIPAEQSRLACLESNYALTSSILFSIDDEVLIEVVSRLSRKLDPQASQRLFPLPSVDRVVRSSVAAMGSAEEGGRVVPLASDSPWGQLALFEMCMTGRRLHHASRLLTLACDQVGGSSDLSSATRALFIALGLLVTSAKQVSLLIAAECADFCVRLETMTLSLHDDNEGKSSAVEETLGDSEDADDDWRTGLFTQLGNGLMDILTLSSKEKDRAVKRGPPPTLPSPGPTTSWSAAQYIDTARGASSFEAAVVSGVGSVTLHAIGSVLRELLQAKRIFAAALVSRAILFRSAVKEPYVSEAMAALSRARSHSSVEGVRISDSGHPQDGSSGGPQNQSRSPQPLDVMKALRMYKVKQAGLRALLLRETTSTQLRRHCEHEIEHSRLRRPSASQETSSMDSSVRSDTSYQWTSAHKPGYGGPIAYPGPGLEHQRALEHRASFRNSNVLGPEMQFEIDESLYWPSASSSIHSQPSPPTTGYSGAAPSVAVIPTSRYGPMETSRTWGGLLRALVLTYLLSGEGRAAAVLLVLLGRPDLACLCLPPLITSTALDINIVEQEAIRQVYTFCAADCHDGGGDQQGLLPEAELRAQGRWEAVKTLQGVLGSLRESTVADVVASVEEMLARL